MAILEGMKVGDLVRVRGPEYIFDRGMDSYVTFDWKYGLYVETFGELKKRAPNQTYFPWHEDKDCCVYVGQSREVWKREGVEVVSEAEQI